MYSLVRNQLALGFDYNREQIIKGIDEPVAVYAVRMTGRNEPKTGPQFGQSAPGGEKAETSSTLSSMAGRAEAGLAWLKLQPRRVRMAAGLIAVFFILNILFSGIANPWFVFPSAPLALYIYLRYRRVKSLKPGRGPAAASMRRFLSNMVSRPELVH